VRHRSFAERHPVLLGLGILIWLGLVFVDWPVLVAAGILTVVLIAVFLAARAEARRRDQRRRYRAAIAARADYEHAAIMRGDAWLGTFGRYQPAPLWWA
jgi:hypothetical protein